MVLGVVLVVERRLALRHISYFKLAFVSKQLRVLGIFLSSSLFVRVVVFNLLMKNNLAGYLYCYDYFLNLTCNRRKIPS